jgi:hypothetical protein
VKNTNPITRARRLETRRKKMGYAICCFYCGEPDPSCFEKDHPVTKKLDRLNKRTVCRNCHRKLELHRDSIGLTENGRHNVIESECERERRCHLLFADDLDSIADVVQSPNTSREMIAAALREDAASLRRTAPTLQPSRLPDTSIVRETPVPAESKCA